MQETMQLGQVVQPSILSSVEGFVKNFRQSLSAWWAAPNQWFSAFTGEQVCNRHVVLAHLYMVALVVAMIVASWLEGGAA